MILDSLHNHTRMRRPFIVKVAVIPCEEVLCDGTYRAPVTPSNMKNTKITFIESMNHRSSIFVREQLGQGFSSLR